MMQTLILKKSIKKADEGSYLLIMFLMTNIKRKLFIVFVTGVALTAPMAVVVVIRDMQSESATKEQNMLEMRAKQVADDAQFKYYQEVLAQRERLRQGMVDAKNQYEQQLKDQPQAIQNNQQTVVKTIVEPVVTQQTVSVSAAASAPKSSAKTKTS